MESLKDSPTVESASQLGSSLDPGIDQEGLCDPELSKKRQIAQAQDHDRRVRQIERQIIASWSELAEIAIQVRDGEEWAVLGYSSFNAWLLNAAPRSRAMIYSAIGLLEELKSDVPIQDLREIDIGNAHLLKCLPRASRTATSVLEAAKTLPPREMRSWVMESHPELILEKLAIQRFKFTHSQWLVIEKAIEEVMEQYDGEITSKEEALEAIVSEWRLSQ